MTATSKNIFEEHTDNPIFKDQTPLNTQITPTKEKFVGREEEQQEIVEKLSYMVEGQTADNFLVTGNTGYGKTACVQLVLNDLDEVMGPEFKTVYVRDVTSENDALREISSSLQLGTQAKTNRTHYNALKEYIVDNDHKVALVLDEIDKVFNNSNRKDHGNSLFKNLLEARKDALNTSDGSLVIIGITNEVNVDEKFDPRVRSRFEDNGIQFSSYNANQLAKILRVRAKDAFKPGVLEDGVIRKCAALVAQKDGDARKAIELLKKAAKLAVRTDAEVVTKRHVDKAKKRIERDKTLEAVGNLPKQEKIVLYTLLTMRKQRTTTGELYSKYKTKCNKLNISTVTQRRVQELVQDLDMMGLVTAKVKNLDGRRGRTREISHNHNDDLEENIVTFMEEEVFQVGDE